MSWQSWSVNPSRRVVAALVVSVVLAMACAADGQQGRTGAEQRGRVDDESRLMALVNESRREKRLPSLVRDPALDADARAHTMRLVERRRLFHRSTREFRRLSVTWIRVGENVATAGEIEELHQHLMDSPLHKANILGPFTRAGIGVMRDSRGRLWATELFVAQ